MTEEGIRLKVDKNPETSMVRVFMPEKQNGENNVEVKYEGTFLQRLSYIVNAIAVLAVAVAAVLYCWKGKKFGEKQ